MRISFSRLSKSVSMGLTSDEEDEESTPVIRNERIYYFLAIIIIERAPSSIFNFNIGSPAVSWMDNIATSHIQPLPMLQISLPNEMRNDS